ncbi:unnamed protein product [Prunus armeniaca]|uniref:Uncharacterized protein n=1 Tax=Prunus armeniaca TaxID=36596 RepID=A0A6J5XX12_PRUAR|nr:unnamed protein product [Prunus armeniaca]
MEVELETIDKDGYFGGSLLESNTHVVIPILEAALQNLKMFGPTIMPVNFIELRIMRERRN